NLRAGGVMQDEGSCLGPPHVSFDLDLVTEERPLSRERAKLGDVGDEHRFGSDAQRWRGEAREQQREDKCHTSVSPGCARIHQDECNKSLKVFHARFSANNIEIWALLAGRVGKRKPLSETFSKPLSEVSDKVFQEAFRKNPKRCSVVYTSPSTR